MVYTRTHFRPRHGHGVLGCLLGCSLGFFAMGCAARGNAVPSLHPTTLAATSIAGGVQLQVQGVTDEELCSEPATRDRVCFTRTQTALTEGLGAVLQTYGMSVGTRGHTAVLRISGLTRATGSPATLSVGWEYLFSGPDGAPIVRLSDRTEAPEPSASGREGASPAQRMFEAVLERIEAEMNRVLVPSSSGS